MAAKTAFYRDKFDTRINNSKQLWINLSKIGSLGKTKTKTIISELVYNNEIFSEPQKICGKLNEYFCSVGAILVQSLNLTGYQDFKKYCPPSCKNSMFCTPVLTEEIIKIIQKFPTNKAPGKDNINAKLLKVISKQVTTPLTYIINLSFASGEIPTELKIAKVIPIYKLGDRKLPDNFRPISLLSIFEKIMEKCTQDCQTFWKKTM